MRNPKLDKHLRIVILGSQPWVSTTSYNIKVKLLFPGEGEPDDEVDDEEIVDGDIVDIVDRDIVEDIVDDSIKNNLLPFQQSFHNFKMSLICSNPEEKANAMVLKYFKYSNVQCVKQ